VDTTNIHKIRRRQSGDECQCKDSIPGPRRVPGPKEDKGKQGLKGDVGPPGPKGDTEDHGPRGVIGMRVHKYIKLQWKFSRIYLSFFLNDVTFIYDRHINTRTIALESNRCPIYIYISLIYSNALLSGSSQLALQVYMHTV